MKSAACKQRNRIACVGVIMQFQRSELSVAPRRRFHSEKEHSFSWPPASNQPFQLHFFYLKEGPRFREVETSVYNGAAGNGGGVQAAAMADGRTVDGWDGTPAPPSGEEHNLTPANHRHYLG